MTALVQLAQYHMDYGRDHMDGGWGVGMIVLMVLLVVALVALVVVLARGFAGRRTAGGRPDSAIAILDRRLAAGEITPEDHQQRLAILGGR